MNRRTRAWASCGTTVLLLLAGVLAMVLLHPATASAQDALQPGEGFITRFSGTAAVSSAGTVIDTSGTVGSIVDFSNPAQPPLGQHWLNEPQRNPVTAGQVGQVFGVAIDDAVNANIYLTATSAFGLHRTADKSGWMPGMWGPGAGPGTVWKLDGSGGYAPAPFANITLDGRENSGAALGNIAYDRWNKQLYVSDLETGMIHRLRAADGSDAGRYDHGMEARQQFIDAATGEQLTLPQKAFNPAQSARIQDCDAGEFAATPACWNFADFRRRAWGLGVRKDATSGEVRLYYAVWSGQGFGNPEFDGASDDEKRNSLWSVAIAADGSFAKGSARREFFLPDFFTEPGDLRRAGYSHPVTDIAFAKCAASNVMLVSERGGVRNLGLDQENAFATPHESRVLRYELGDDGVWQNTGRYDVGFYDRKNEKNPYLRANSCGGIDFGYGYQQDWSLDTTKPDQFVWMNGDALCSPFAPCFVPDQRQRIDGSQVHGSQGTPESGFDEVLPPGATQPYPPSGEPYAPKGPIQSWMVDTDINVDPNGLPLVDTLTRNDATRIGDVEIHQPCHPDQPPGEDQPPVVDEPPGIEDPPVVDEPPPDDGPDLEKTKDGPAQCVEGDICTFTITITNNGPGPWSGPLWELDTLPPGAILFDYRTQPEWLCTQSGDQVYCNYDWADLAAGDSVTLEMDVFIPGGYAGQVVENCVEDIWLPSNDPNDPALIQAVEQALAGLGYVTGQVDGFLDIVTMNAISQYQADNGLAQTGLPDQILIDQLFPGAAGLPGDSNPDNDGDCHQVEILPPPAPPGGPTQTSNPPDIQVVKIQTSGTCRPGGLCTFRLVGVNRGPGDYIGRIVLVDSLPPGSTLVNPPQGCSQSGNSVTCRYPFTPILRAGRAVGVLITVRMPNNLRPGARNCVSASIPNDPNAGNNRHCIPIRVAEPPSSDIRTHKAQVGEHCHAGGECSFDLWFINRGPAIWTRRIRLNDRLPPGVKFLKATDPWRCTQSGVNLACYRSPAWVRPGRSVRVRVTVQLPEDFKDGTQNCVRVARQAGAPRDRVPHNDQHCIPVRVTEDTPVKPTDIAIDKRQTGKCEPGGVCNFKLTFINNGPGAWTGKPQITEQLPTREMSITGWAPSSWALNENNTFEHPQMTLPPGGKVELNLSMQLPENASSESKMQNCATIDPEAMKTPDSNPANNRKCVPIDIHEPQEPETVAPPTNDTDIGIEKMLAPYNPSGDEGGCETGCIIRLVVTNHGSSTWSGPLVVRDLSLPPGTNMVRGLSLSQAQPGWACDDGGRCTSPSVRLDPGEGKVLDFYVALSQVPRGGHWRNCAEIVGNRDQNSENDRHCVNIPVTSPPVHVSEPPPPPSTGPGNIRVQKSQSGRCDPGSQCTFIIRYINAGSSTWSGTPRVSDVITAGGARVTDWTPKDWQCRVASHSTNCTHRQVSLPPQGSVSLSLTMRMPPNLSRGAQNCVIRLGNRDTNPGDDRHCVPVHTAPPQPEFTPHPPTVVRPPTHTEPAPTPTVVTCPRGTVRRGSKCVTIIRKCPRGTYRRGKVCVRPQTCPRGTYKRGRVCVRPPRCPRGMTRIGSICINIPGIINTIRPPKGPRRPEGGGRNCHRRPGGGVHCGRG